MRSMWVSAVFGLIDSCRATWRVEAPLEPRDHRLMFAGRY